MIMFRPRFQPVPYRSHSDRNRSATLCLDLKDGVDVGRKVGEGETVKLTNLKTERKMHEGEGGDKNIERLSMTLTCHMTLSHYPFDRQVCPLTLGSYGFTTQNLVYHWADDKTAIVIHGDVQLPTFSITNWRQTQCNEFVDSNLGSFSCMQVSLYLARAYGYYLAQVYIPSVLIVTLSWVNFWLDIDAIPARISLGLLSVLTMTTMSVGTRSNLPRVSYIKAIDVWTAVCLMFVFSALLEFAYVNVTTRVEKRRLSMREAVKLATVASRTNALAGLRNMEEGKMEPKRSTSQPTVNKRERARTIDKEIPASAVVVVVVVAAAAAVVVVAMVVVAAVAAVVEVVIVVVVVAAAAAVVVVVVMVEVVAAAAAEVEVVVVVVLVVVVVVVVV
ncbi:LOW QUALITY PROTEIN: glycine receptor subunit alpha-3 [Elysia marginata]|uniref:Glycine receptor subunit alpha-3 n=1 Tax=Elysia marginata TaxID=1093978 RepID=A0AAV4HQB2_9GAST|nr:LOW QUALITY PROTEIN: glycine receptor subunit alpha-3 [Elysia marginata]